MAPIFAGLLGPAMHQASCQHPSTHLVFCLKSLLDHPKLCLRYLWQCGWLKLPIIVHDTNEISLTLEPKLSCFRAWSSAALYLQENIVWDFVSLSDGFVSLLNGVSIDILKSQIRESWKSSYVLAFI